MDRSFAQVSARAAQMGDDSPGEKLNKTTLRHSVTHRGEGNTGGVDVVGPGRRARRLRARFGDIIVKEDYGPERAWPRGAYRRSASSP